MNDARRKTIELPIVAPTLLFAAVVEWMLRAPGAASGEDRRADRSCARRADHGEPPPARPRRGRPGSHGRRDACCRASRSSSRSRPEQASELADAPRASSRTDRRRATTLAHPGGVRRAVRREPDDLAPIVAWLTARGSRPARRAERDGDHGRRDGGAGGGDVPHRDAPVPRRRRAPLRDGARAVACPRRSRGVGRSGARRLHDARSRAARAGAVHASPVFNLNGNHTVAPEDFATIYDVAKLHAKGLDGTRDDHRHHGAQPATRCRTSRRSGSVTGLPPIDLPTVLVPARGDPAYIDAARSSERRSSTSSSPARSRRTRRSSTSTRAAPPGYDVRNALQYAIDNKVADIVSISWGGCEARTSPAAGVTMAPRNMVDPGQRAGHDARRGDRRHGRGGVRLSPGKTLGRDQGAGGPSCRRRCPEFTAVGGTEFAEGAGTYWSASNDAKLGSALSYIPETAWNDTAALEALWATGGGVSTLFPKPAWQVGAGVPNDGQRDVPDVSLNASGYHDRRSPTSAAGRDQRRPASTGSAGTSASTPSFAGIVALVEQADRHGPARQRQPDALHARRAEPVGLPRRHDRRQHRPLQAGDDRLSRGGAVPVRVQRGARVQSRPPGSARSTRSLS